MAKSTPKAQSKPPGKLTKAPPAKAPAKSTPSKAVAKKPVAAKTALAKAAPAKAVASKAVAKKVPVKKPAIKQAPVSGKPALAIKPAAATAKLAPKAPIKAAPHVGKKTEAKPTVVAGKTPAKAVTKPAAKAVPAPATKPAPIAPKPEPAPVAKPVAAKPAPAVKSEAATSIKSRKEPLRKPTPPAPAITKPAPEPEVPKARVPQRKPVKVDVILPENYRPSPDEEYMCSLHLAFFRDKLDKMRQQLISDSQDTIEHLRTETRDVGDEAERASRESDNILELRTRDRERKLLRKIEETLKRIEDGSYGYCEETGEEIGLGRLDARPTATLTVDAQERREKLQKQFRDDH